MLDVEKFKAGREGVPSSSAHDQEGGGINKGMTMTMTMMAALNFMTMAIVIAAIVCAFIGSGSEIGSRRLFIVNVITGRPVKGGGVQQSNKDNESQMRRRTGGVVAGGCEVETSANERSCRDKRHGEQE